MPSSQINSPLLKGHESSLENYHDLVRIRSIQIHGKQTEPVPSISTENIGTIKEKIVTF